MFRKASTKSGARDPGNGSGRPAMPTIIGADFRVKGDISCEGDIQLEGTVEGNIKSLRLTVGEPGAVHGDVSAETVKVQGKIVGTIRAKTVELAGTAHVTGDILHETLTVENGAFLNGHCRRLTASEILAEAEARDSAKGEEKKPDAKAEIKTEDRLQVVSGGR